MSVAAAQPISRFVRKTTLNGNEYRVNFKQIDNDAIRALVSPEARKVTPQMSTIYMSLLMAPQDCWERDGVIHFTGEDREEGHLTAWEQMREITGVANSTLSKALDWMHQTGIIGYDARANGVGVRIFFNRASSSIRSRTQQKILCAAPTPSAAAPTPSVGTRFIGSSHETISDNQEIRAFARHSNQPLNGGAAIYANRQKTEAPAREGSTLPDEERTRPCNGSQEAKRPAFQSGPARSIVQHATSIAALAKQLAAEFQSEIVTAVKHESAGIREWFLSHGVPKATRVAQRETYDLLRSHGIIAGKRSSSAQVGLSRDHLEQVARVERGREGKSDDAGIASFIAETGLALREVSNSLGSLDDQGAAGRTALSAACLAAGEELGRLRDRIAAGEPLSIGEIEEQLAAIDAGIAESLWEAIGAADRETMLKSARAGLQPYAAHMKRADFDELVRKRVISELRARHGIPHLSLFYL